MFVNSDRYWSAVLTSRCTNHVFKHLCFFGVRIFHRYRFMKRFSDVVRFYEFW